MTFDMEFTPLDITKWERGEIFHYFSKMAPIGYSLTVDFDATKMHGVLKRAGFKFFPGYLWLVTKNLNQQKEFKIAELDGRLGYFNVLTPLYATFHEETKTFSLMWTRFDDDFKAFHSAYMENKRRYGANHGILAQKNMLPPANAYTVSCLPWMPFKHFAVHSYENKPYYLPSVEAGGFFHERNATTGEDRLMMPLSITCSHAATDGWHISQFLTSLQHDADSFEEFL